MKTKYLLAFILVLLGTNVFTFATARYWTTRHVLTRAHESVVAVLDKQRAGELRPGQTPEMQIQRAVSMAGGMYYWWNDGLAYWGVGAIFTLSGLAVMAYEPRRKDAVNKED